MGNPLQSIEFPGLGEYEIINPKDYGLCGFSVPIDSLDDASVFGLYQSNVGGPTDAMWDCLTIPLDKYFATQIACKTNSDECYICVRKKQNGVWGEWEWVNAPMVSGVEYRTTKRWLNKPVYQKYIQIGAVAAGSNTISHGITGFTGCVSIQLTDGSHQNVTQHPNVSGLYVTASGIFLTVGEAQTFHATLEYTKS